jgi:hypothetical protein
MPFSFLLKGISDFFMKFASMTNSNTCLVSAKYGLIGTYQYLDMCSGIEQLDAMTEQGRYRRDVY